MSFQDVLQKTVEEVRPDILYYLLINGIRPKEGSHLLHLAVQQNQPALIAKLVDVTPVNEKDDNGKTPLFYVQSEWAANILLEHGALLDVQDNDGKLPHECITKESIASYLRTMYQAKHPVVEVLPQENASNGESDWNSRFSTEIISLEDLKPVNVDAATGSFGIEYNGNQFHPTERFLTSFARKLKFSNNIYRYFDANEVFSRVAEKNPELKIQVTFDHYNNDVLGVIDESKKFLPPAIACHVFSEDPRINSVKFENGIWEAELQLDSHFEIKGDGIYSRKLRLEYPVDGMSMPAFYLGIYRQICSNGAVVMTSSFRTDIEISDTSGTHLTRLLESYSNENGFLALENRIQSAQNTTASVNEVLMVRNLLEEHVSEKSLAEKLIARLEEMAGDPALRYETTSLNNISPKQRSLLPVECSVNDLINFCTELTTHHENVLSNVRPFHVALGNLLDQEFDLEKMYHNKRPARPFMMDDMDLPKYRTQESARRLHDTVFSHE